LFYAACEKVIIMARKKQTSNNARDNDISLKKIPSMKKKIIVADDDPGIRDIFQLILEKAGYEIDLRSNGKEILSNTAPLPDLYLLDKQMSGTDGLEICRHLKSQEQTKHIPVIMISAAPDIGTLANKAGADDFIEKPFTVDFLLNRIKKNIEARLINAEG
jgi:DNA-binding response OmpR family regulator